MKVLPNKMSTSWRIKPHSLKEDLDVVGLSQTEVAENFTRIS
jgi:hypothetical protein